MIPMMQCDKWETCPMDCEDKTPHELDVSCYWECGVDKKAACIPVPSPDQVVDTNKPLAQYGTLYKPLNYKEIFAKGVRVKGIDSQIDGAIEEMAELIKALIKVKRLEYEKFSPESDESKQRMENVAEEIADVSLAIQQIIYMFGLTTVDDWKENKMQRYAQKLEEFNDRQ